MRKISKKELDIILRLGSYLSTIHDVDKTLSLLLESAENLLNAKASEKLKGLTVPMGEGIAGWVALNGKPRIVLQFL